MPPLHGLLSHRRVQRQTITGITLYATPKGNGYQATANFPGGVSIGSAETYPTLAEAMTSAALNRSFHWIERKFFELIDGFFDTRLPSTGHAWVRFRVG